MPRMLHVDPDTFLLDTFRLGQKIYEAGIRPKHVISVWRGGTPVGLGVDAYFRSRGLRLNHTTIATESFTGIAERGDVAIKGLEHVVKVVCPEDGLLIIDDVYESGRTIGKIVDTIRRQARANAPDQIVVAAVHSKPALHVYKELPIVSLHDIDADVWIDYPHELADLVDPNDPDDAKLREKDADIWGTLRSEPEAPTRVHTSGATRYVGARELLLEAIRLGTIVAADRDFHPHVLLALWPGGVTTGLPLHEVIKYRLKKSGSSLPSPDHISLNTTETHLSYRSNVIGIRYLEERINRHDNVLIVDATFRSGRLFSDVMVKLKEALRRNLDHERVRMASVYFNPDDRSTWTVRPIIDRPHYYLREVDHDVVFPQSVHRLHHPEKDLREHAPELADLLFGRVSAGDIRA